MDTGPLVVILDAIASMGALGVAGLVIWGLLTEKIVPKSRLDEATRQRDNILTDRDRLRAELDQYRRRR